MALSDYLRESRKKVINHYSYYFTDYTIRSARDDLSDGRRPAQIPQLDTPHASKESHNSIHNHTIRQILR